ncbi:hypothetical protein ACF05L_28835 [Streptomyces bobili]
MAHQHHRRHVAAANRGEIIQAAKHQLKQIEYRPHVIDHRLAGTGLALGS